MREQIMKTSATSSNLDESLLTHFQKDFPLVSEPFAYMARCLDNNETEIIERLQELTQRQMLTRVGPVFDHRRAGASLLAAVSVPKEQEESIAQKINAYSEVNHNYAREHLYNLWFVVTAPNDDVLHERLKNMEQDLGYPILRLPMVKSYHIDLGFQLHHENLHSSFTYQQRSFVVEPLINHKALLNAFDQHYLRVLIQQGISLDPRPFKIIAEKLSVKTKHHISEDNVLNTLRYWQKTGLIKRFGLISNHYKMGYQSSAMIVWNIPENQIDQVGAQFKSSGLVSLCYQRVRRLPDWPFNLFCMIHSKDRSTVIAHVHELETRFNLAAVQKEILFTRCQYKQKGGVYTGTDQQLPFHLDQQHAMDGNAVLGEALNG